MPLNSGMSLRTNFGRFTSRMARSVSLSSDMCSKRWRRVPAATRMVFTARMP